jgi:hypothetical protein
MAKQIKGIQSTSGIPCCPDITAGEVCNALSFTYRLDRQVRNERTQQPITVEIGIRVRVELCRGGLSLGKLAYSTTLFPGEKVRLFTRDRRNRFVFDKSSSLSYRHEQSYEEQFYLSTFSQAMSELTVTESGNSRTDVGGSTQGKATSTGVFESIFGGAGGKVSGSFDGFSASTFMRELSQHAKATHERSAEGTKSINAVSIGEVNQQLRAAGESQEHYEASSREFRNANRCHAVTYFFYQLDQEQRLRFHIEAINRRVVDPAANTEVTQRKQAAASKVEVLPSAILATDAKRLQVETADLESTSQRIQNRVLFHESLGRSFGSSQPTLVRTNFVSQPFTVEEKQAAIAQVDDELVAAGLLNAQSKQVSELARREYEFEIKTQLPTGGLYVQSCLDECSVCEPTREQEIQLDLQRKRLENELLRRRIELLHQAQEYRCCPAGDITLEIEEN